LGSQFAWKKQWFPEHFHRNPKHMAQGSTMRRLTSPASFLALLCFVEARAAALELHRWSCFVEGHHFPAFCLGFAMIC
jgi:hypothetical protein